MTPIDLIGSQPGRVLRVAAGTGIIAAGLRRGDSVGWTIAVLGLLPLIAGAADVCVLGPLVRAPLRGQAFREHRARQRLDG